MKNFLQAVLIKIFQIVVFLVTTIWLSMWIGLMIPAMFVSILIVSEKNSDIMDQLLNILVLPYKWLGVCSDWKSFTEWMVKEES